MMTKLLERAVFSVTAPFKEDPWTHSIFLAFQLPLFILVGWWFWHNPKHVPTPGIAVAYMALAAALLSVHAARGWQKAAWMAIIASLLTVEIRAIKKDRDEANASAVRARACY